MIARLPDRGVAKLLLFRPYQIHHLTLCVRSSHLKSGANLALTLRQIWGNRKLSFVDFDHHLTHAAMACYTSPFSEAACLVVDGIGDYGSVAAYTYRDGTVTPLARHRGSESLGALYMLVTDLCGFSIFKGEEWKVMGLAAYGRRDADLYRELSAMVRAVGLGLRYAPMRRIRAIVRALETRRRGPDRSPLAAADLAHTWQIVFSEVMDALARTPLRRDGCGEPGPLWWLCAEFELRRPDPRSHPLQEAAHPLSAGRRRQRLGCRLARPPAFPSRMAAPRRDPHALSRLVDVRRDARAAVSHRPCPAASTSPG